MPAHSSAIIHILQVLSALICLHTLYPKGVTYGEPDDWEIKARERREANKKEQRRHARRERERKGWDEYEYEYRGSEKRDVCGQRRLESQGHGQRRLEGRRCIDEVKYLER